MNESDLTGIIVGCAILYLMAATASCMYLLLPVIDGDYPRVRNDAGFTFLALLASILLALIWPLSLPIVWTGRSCVHSEKGCCGFNRKAYKAKRRARKEQEQQRRDWVKMGRMERVVQADEARRVAEEGDWQVGQDQGGWGSPEERTKRQAEARERVQRLRESLRGFISGHRQESGSGSQNFAISQPPPAVVSTSRRTAEASRPPS